MNLAFRLYRLQQVDSQLDEHRVRLEEIAELLADDRELQRARATADATAEALATHQKALRKAEQNTQAQRLKIQRTETKLYSGRITSPKELQDLQNESAALKRYLNVLEDRQLEAMLLVDEAKEQDEAAQQALVQAEATKAESHASLAGEQSKREARVARLLEERQAALEGIGAEDLGMYTKLRQQKGGLAVALVSDQTCTACGSTLSAALAQQARSPEAAARCSSCKRIVYAK